MAMIPSAPGRSKADQRDGAGLRPRRPSLIDAMASDTCPDPNELAAYIDDALGPDVVRLIRGHVRSCRPCREVVREAKYGRSSWGLSRIGLPIGPAFGRWVRRLTRLRNVP